MKKAFTLIEILIASAIFAEVAVIGAVTITNISRVSSATTQNGLKQEALRSVLERIEREVRGATTINITSDKHIQIDKDDSKKSTEIWLDTATSTIKLNKNGATDSLTPIKVKVTNFTVNGIDSNDAEHRPVYVYVHLSVTGINDTTALDATSVSTPRLWLQ